MMYPFKAKEYDIEFLWSPRWAPPHVQDKLGWNGEGMTDKRFLDASPARSPGIPGGRKVFFRLRITRDQILRLGEWRDKVPKIESAGFVEVPEVLEFWQTPAGRRTGPAAVPQPAPKQRKQ
jgi:hypothetical protein